MVKLTLKIMAVLVLGIVQAQALSQVPGDLELEPVILIEPVEDPLPAGPIDPEQPDICGVQS